MCGVYLASLFFVLCLANQNRALFFLFTIYSTRSGLLIQNTINNRQEQKKMEGRVPRSRAGGFIIVFFFFFFGYFFSPSPLLSFLGAHVHFLSLQVTKHGRLKSISQTLLFFFFVFLGHVLLNNWQGGRIVFFSGIAFHMWDVGIPSVGGFFAHQFLHFGGFVWGCACPYTTWSRTNFTCHGDK